MSRTPKVALLWRGDRTTRDHATPTNNRLIHIFEALTNAGIDAEPAVYDESFADEVHAQLLKTDAVLVWVDPLSGGKTRMALDPLLREVAANGIWISTHPAVTQKMGTKEVLVATKALGWGADTHIYRSPQALRHEFPQRLEERGVRVLKRKRGNGGQGVWKVERLSTSAGSEVSVRVLHAQKGNMPEELPLRSFMDRCEAYFAEDGGIIDQPFQQRLPDGMIRCYMATDQVAGFGHQFVKALISPPPEGPDSPEAQPGPRIMHPPSAPQFERLRRNMETEWTPQMMKILDITASELPVIWDADFLYGPRDAEGNDTYVLCEINVSSVFPIPDQAPQAIADRVRAKFGLR